MAIDWKEAENLDRYFTKFTREHLSSKPGRISAEGLINMLDNNEKVLILDIRTDYEADLAGYTIKNSIRIPMDRLFRRKNLEKLMEYQDHKIVLSCHSGVRTLVASAFLQRIGFTNTFSLEGGLAAFALAVHP